MGKINYHIFESIDTILTHYQGDIYLPELINNEINIIAKDPHIKTINKAIYDFRCSNLQLTHDDVVYYVKELDKLQKEGDTNNYVKESRTAFLADDPNNVVYTTLFKMINDFPFISKIFYTLESCMGFLTLPDGSYELIYHMIKSFSEDCDCGCDY